MFVRGFFRGLLLLLLLGRVVAAMATGTDSTCTLHGGVSECVVSNPIAAAAAARMPYARLGRSGLLVSRLSYGAWITFGTTVDEKKAYEILKLCLDAGINFFDNAEAYGSGIAEEVMGRALKRLEKEYPLPRSHYVLTTKIFFGTSRGKERSRWVPNQKGLSRKHVIEGTMASLARLQVDYVDVVFAHRPDEHTPMEEVVRAFNHVIERGFAFYWCTSEWSAEQIRHAIMIADKLGLIAPICEQPQYNMLHRDRMEREYSSLFRDTGYGTTIWSALSSGLLTGKYNDGIPPSSRLSQASAEYILRAFKDGSRHREISGGWDAILDRVRKLRPIADRLECTMAQLAIAWVLKNEHVTTVILGATKQSQIEDNLGSLNCLARIDGKVLAEIDTIMGNKPNPTKDWNANPSL
jgi:voltage-dependent potassium channel beta subunit